MSRSKKKVYGTINSNSYLKFYYNKLTRLKGRVDIVNDDLESLTTPDYGEYKTISGQYRIYDSIDLAYTIPQREARYQQRIDYGFITEDDLTYMRYRSTMK